MVQNDGWAQESQAFFRRAFEQAPALIAILRGPNHVFSFTNHSYQSLIGHRQVLGKPLREALAEVDPGIVTVLDGVYGTGTPFVGAEVGLPVDRRGDGTIETAYFNFVYQPTRDDEGCVDGILIHAVEVTEQVLARREVQESERRFRALSTASALVVWRTAPDGFVTDMPDWRAYTGQTVEENRGWGWLDAIHPADRAATAEDWARSVETKSAVEIEYRIRRHDGVYRWFVSRGVPVLDDAGGIAEWVGTCTDIEDRRAAQAALAEANESLSAQTEELRAQQEELVNAQEALRRHSEQVEAEVVRRTEDLQAANEELHMQAEELAAQAGELQRAEAERQSFWNLSLDLMVIVDGASPCFKDVNGAWTAVLGWSREELLTTPFMDFILPEDHQRTIDGVARASGGEVFLHFENRYFTKDGRTRLIEWRAVPVPGGLFYAYGRDVTERRAAEAELARQRELTARIITHAPTGLSYLNRELVYEWINPKQADVFGIPIENIIGRSVYEVLGPETEAQLGSIFAGVLAGEPYHGLGFPFKYTFDGKEAWSYWDFTYQPVPGDDGLPAGVLILANEVSERVGHERLLAEKMAQLEAADRYKDEFLSVISHELRTPLNFITGFASTLDDGVHGPLTAAQAAAVGKILAGSDRMLGIVNDLLDFARLQAGKVQLVVGPTAFTSLAEEVASALRPLAEDKGVTISVESGVPALLPLDGPRVVQVLTNLIGNAVKFTERGGQVRVVAALESERLLCEVTDDGRGIAPEDLPKLFARFSQLDMSSTRQTGGTGLGLAITKALVEAHGGTIGVRSEGVGRGSTFWFMLPAVPETQRENRQEQRARVKAAPVEQERET